MAADEPTKAAFVDGAVETRDAAEKILRGLQDHLTAQYEKTLKLRNALRAASELLVEDGHAVTKDKAKLQTFFAEVSRKSEVLENKNDVEKVAYLKQELKSSGVFFKPAPAEAQPKQEEQVQTRGLRRGSSE